MGVGVIAGVLLIGGGLVAFMIHHATEHEYPLAYWLAWGCAVGGLLGLVAVLNPLRTSYVAWSSALGLILTGLFFAGKTDGEFSPGAWCGAAILAVNALLGLGLRLPATTLALGFSVVAIVMLVVGQHRRRRERSGYDAAYSAGAIVLVVAGLLATRSVKTPLEYVHDVAIPRRNAALAAAQERVASYAPQLEQAQRYRSQIDEQFADEDAAYLEMADRYIATASASHAQAETIVREISSAALPASTPVAELQAAVENTTQRATAAANDAQAALDALVHVQRLFEDLSEEWIKEYLWFEVDGYWTSEENENPSYNVCYYGERVSTRTQDGAREQIVSDAVDRTGQDALFGGDQANVDWKYFTVDDYNDLVNSGIVPAAPDSINSDEEASYYLCGQHPQGGQYGVLGEPPAVIEKAYGSLQREVSDEGASFVGDSRYGTWCVADANGTITPIAEEQTPPADAQWCWYQKPGDSTNYYWERRGSGTSVVWIRSHRRCVYCAPQAQWAGGALVPDAEMARVNSTDGSEVRGPLDQGGGPGTGK